MRLPVLFDPVSERFQAPILDFSYFPAVLFENALKLLLQSVGLLHRYILAQKENMFVKRHS
jgi:hypothetical protein